MLPNLIKIACFCLIGLLLYGAVSGGQIAWLLLSFAVWWGFRIIAEWFRKIATEEEWEALRQELHAGFEVALPEDCAEAALSVGLPADAATEEIAEALVMRYQAEERPLRAKRELAAEVLGLLSFSLLLPLCLALYALNFFSFHLSHEWTAFAACMLCLALFYWPFRWGSLKARIYWWALPFLPLLMLTWNALETKHPYLNPFEPERPRLAADRVLALKDNVVAGRHAHWVARYAADLATDSRPAQALGYYQAAKSLDPQSAEVASAIEQLERDHEARTLSSEAAVDAPPPVAASNRAPLLPSGFDSVRLPRTALDHRLSQLPGVYVVLVPIGPVEEYKLQAVRAGLHRELGLDCLVARDEVPLPEHSRRRGFVIGKQWSIEVMMDAFRASFPQPPVAPVKYLVVTEADIYSGNANFLFSAWAPWGAILSTARYEMNGENTHLVAERTAKQSLCAILKSFGVPASSDPDCVTSYSNGLRQFDQKGSRPAPETRRIFQEHVAQMRHFFFGRSGLNREI
jgi:hypothetical protein